jgi:hypothetical protein
MHINYSIEIIHGAMYFVGGESGDRLHSWGGGVTKWEISEQSNVHYSRSKRQRHRNISKTTIEELALNMKLREDGNH